MDTETADPKERVISLGQQGQHYRLVAQITGVNPNTVKTWFRRAGIRIARPDSETVAVVREEKGKDSDHSTVVRARLGRALVKITEHLEQLPDPVQPEQMQERVELIKGIADPAKDVFGWGNTTGTTAISVHMLSTAQVVREPQAIDVPSSTAPVPPEQVEGRP